MIPNVRLMKAQAPSRRVWLDRSAVWHLSLFRRRKRTILGTPRLPLPSTAVMCRTRGGPLTNLCWLLIIRASPSVVRTDAWACVPVSLPVACPWAPVLRPGRSVRAIRLMLTIVH